MKVCIFTETYFPVMGGGETQARLLAEGLVARGHSVVILTRRSDASLPSHEKYADIDVYRLAPMGNGQLKKWGLIFTAIPKLIQLRNRYDILFVSGYRIIGLTAVLLAKLLGKRVILKADSQGEMSGEFFRDGLQKFGTSPASFLFKRFLKFRNFILKKADAFSAISPEIASEWTSSGIPSDKIHLIPNSVDTAVFTPLEPSQKLELRDQLKLPREAVIAIYTGRLVSYKGLPLLLKVWDDIRKKHQDAVLILAGTGGLDIHNCEAELRGYVISHHMEQHVRFTGAVQNVAQYLQASDIFVFPTENDAFPSSVVEAMACALPVIATPVGAIKTIIRHEENGILIEPGNHMQLLRALDVMISNAAQPSPMGLAARETVCARYSAERSNEKYISLYQSTLDRHGNRNFMKQPFIKTTIIALIFFAIGLIAGIYVGMKRGIPFVTQREQWTIGIYRSDSPFHFNALQGWINPLFRAEDVTDVNAKFVADPFLVKQDKTWNLFFEVYDNDTKQGDLAVATSTNTWTWKYHKVILDEPFHLSYPYVFQSDGEYYLIPESFEDNSIRLYKADEFPTRWTFVKRLVEGRDYVDNSIVYYHNKWWLFSSVTTNDKLYLHYADSLTGPWKEHPMSPIVENDVHKSRPSGRLLVYDGKLFRFTMDIQPPVGTHQVMAYEITEITPDMYVEKIAQEAPVLMASGSGWNGQAMHQLDPVQVDSNSWIASVDGFGTYWIFGWKY